MFAREVSSSLRASMERDGAVSLILSGIWVHQNPPFLLSKTEDGVAIVLVQGCVNYCRCYLVIAEYGDGGRRGFHIIPEGIDGKG